MSSDQRPLQLSISLNVLNHLGRQLYSNVPAVLSELIANAWDADATRVDVTINRDADQIVVQDNGLGMSRQEVNDFYLHVGYERRADDRTYTPRFRRHVMGRKGIGKLSAFGIADDLEVHTVAKATGEKTAFRMSYSEIERKIREEHEQRARRRKTASDTAALNGGDAELSVPEEMEPVPYRPTDLVEKHGPDVVEIKEGTRIVLTDLNKRLVRTEEHLARRVARRFGIIGPAHHFQVLINGAKVTAADRDYFGKLEFLWTFGPNSKAIERAGSVKNVEVLSPEVPYYENEPFRLSGWIGTVEKPSDIPDVDAVVPIYAHGKLVHENVLTEFKEARIYAEYVTGEIYADFLDADDERDIVTTDRQHISPDPRFDSLLIVLKRALERIASQWSPLRTDIAEQRALATAEVREWFEHVPRDHVEFARRLFRDIERLPVSDEAMRLQLYKQSILAFEQLAFWDMLDSDVLGMLETEEEFNVLRQLFSRIDQFEAAQYYQITRGRLQIVEELTEVASSIALERVVREHLPDHLWLIEPIWGETFVGEDERNVEETLGSMLPEEVPSRIAPPSYRRVAGRSIIIDLRGYESVFNYGAEYQRARKMIATVQEILEQPNEPVEVIWVAGSEAADADAHRKAFAALGAGTRVVLYYSLVNDARRRFEDYLKGKERMSKLMDIVKRLDDRADAQRRMLTAESSTSDVDEASVAE